MIEHSIKKHEEPVKHYYQQQHSAFQTMNQKKMSKKEAEAYKIQLIEKGYNVGKKVSTSWAPEAEITRWVDIPEEGIAWYSRDVPDMFYIRRKDAAKETQVAYNEFEVSLVK